MILNEIILHNFRIFKGKHRIDVRPASERKPITLVGGLNGNGKTTLLEALQLALYGQSMMRFYSGNGNYKKYLRQSIHRDIRHNDGASVEVSFSSVVGGKWSQYRLCRSWSFRGEKVREHLDVHTNGRHDQVLAETWNEQVESILPSHLSHLFFFDGEQIEAFADQNRCSDLLKRAIHSLLGVDIVEKLKLDLELLDRRKRKETVEGPDRLEIENVEREFLDLSSNLASLKQERAALQNRTDLAQKSMREIESRFREEGGELLELRSGLEKSQSEIQTKIQFTKERLIELASGPLPLSIVKPLLEQTALQVEKEKLAFQAGVFLHAMDDLSSRLLTELEKKRVVGHVRDFISDFLQHHKQPYERDIDIDRYLDFTKHDDQALSFLLESILGMKRKEASELILVIEKLEGSLEEIDRTLASIPDNDAIRRLIEDRDQAIRTFRSFEQQLADLDVKIDELEKEKQNILSKLNSLLRLGKEVELSTNEVVRFLKHTKRIRETLERFGAALVIQRSGQLENLILDGYKRFLRKESLVSSLAIDPKSFTLTLKDNKGIRIHSSQLSAGERQLLAVAILWALGRASGRPIPVIIDTPLGRLDNMHRNHLVERYFPLASHQVILLSTDEEISKEYFQKLRPRIAHCYRLDYDETSRSSSIAEGYFW